MSAKDSKHMELVTVFETLNIVDLSIAKSILEGENIPFLAKNEVLRNIGGYFPLTPVEIQVGENFVPAALAALEDLINSQDAKDTENVEK